MPSDRRPPPAHTLSNYRGPLSLRPNMLQPAFPPSAGHGDLPQRVPEVDPGAGTAPRTVPLRGPQRGEVASRLALGFALAVGVLCALAPRLQPGGLLARPCAAFAAVAVPHRTAAGARNGRATAGRCGA